VVNGKTPPGNYLPSLQIAGPKPTIGAGVFVPLQDGPFTLQRAHRWGMLT